MICLPNTTMIEELTDVGPSLTVVVVETQTNLTLLLSVISNVVVLVVSTFHIC